MSNRFFQIIDKLLPRANAFYLVVNKRLTQFFKGLAALPQDCKEYFQNIWLDLFPETTRELDNWNDAFGVLVPAITEDDQRMDLDSIWKAQGGQAWEYLQGVLINSGFDVQVHENNPPVDPDIFLNSVPIMYAAGPAAFAGNDQAFAGKTGGELLVNGPILTNLPLYLSVANGAAMFAGNTAAVAGQFNNFITVDKIYQIPDDPDLWGAFFFVGGDATRDPVTHELTAIEKVTVPIERRGEFIRLILKLKPSQTWAGLIINFS